VQVLCGDHFEEAIEDDDEWQDTTGNSSATFLTFCTVCWTAFPTDLRVVWHCSRNSLWPRSRDLPKWSSRLLMSLCGLNWQVETCIIGAGGVGNLLKAVDRLEVSFFNNSSANCTVSLYLINFAWALVIGPLLCAWLKMSLNSSGICVDFWLKSLLASLSSSSDFSMFWKKCFNFATLSTLILFFNFTFAFVLLMSMNSAGPFQFGTNLGFFVVSKSLAISTLSPILNVCGSACLSHCSFVFWLFVKVHS